MKPRATLVLLLTICLASPCIPALAQLPPGNPGGPNLPPVPGAPLPPAQTQLPGPMPTPSAGLPDLVGSIGLSGRAREKAGETQGLRVEILNGAPAKKGVPPPAGGAEVEVLLLTPRAAGAPTGGKGAGVMARERLRIPKLPAPGKRHSQKLRVTIPANLPTGSYVWCIDLDPANRVHESSEVNNRTCLRPPVRIAGREPVPAAELAEEAGRAGAARDLGVAPALPEAGLPAVPPAGARATDLPVALLTLNDDPVGPVDAGREDRVTAAWTVPAAEGDALILAMSETPIEDCPRNRNVRDALGDLARDHVTTPDTGLKPAPGSLPLGLDSPAYRIATTYHVKGCVVREGRTTGGHTNLVALRFGYPILVGGITARAETVVELPDLEVHDIQALTAPGAEGKLWITLADRSGRFRRWYAQTYERPCPAGASCPLREADALARGRGETAYRFPYQLFVDGEPVPEERAGGSLRLTGEAAGETGTTYLPRSGRQSIITDYVLPADGAAHRVRVELNPARRVEAGAGLPIRMVPESDYGNNDLERVLRRELSVRLHLNFGQFVVIRDGDRRSSGELKQLKIRLCREGGGCSPRAEAYSRDRALGRGGLIFSDPLSVDDGDTITGRFPVPDLEVSGSTLDHYFIEVYAYEDDGPCFFANCDDWATTELHFPIPPRLRTGVPDTCGSASTFVPAGEDPRAEGFFSEYRGPGRGPEIWPSTASICVYRTYGRSGP